MSFSIIFILINLIILIGAILLLILGIKLKNRWMLIGAAVAVVMPILSFYALMHFITSM